MPRKEEIRQPEYLVAVAIILITHKTDQARPMAFSTNYFVSTLGEAAQLHGANPQPGGTINDFLDEQSQNVPHFPAVGFPVATRPSAEEASWDCTIFCSYISKIS